MMSTLICVPTTPTAMHVPGTAIGLPRPGDNGHCRRLPPHVRLGRAVRRPHPTPSLARPNHMINRSANPLLGKAHWVLVSLSGFLDSIAHQWVSGSLVIMTGGPIDAVPGGPTPARGATMAVVKAG
jgi:hypothetical protein